MIDMDTDTMGGRKGEGEGEKQGIESEQTAMDDKTIAKSVPILEPAQDKERLEAHIQFCTSGEFILLLLFFDLIIPSGSIQVTQCTCQVTGSCSFPCPRDPQGHSYGVSQR